MGKLALLDGDAIMKYNKCALKVDSLIKAITGQNAEYAHVPNQ